MKKRSIIVYWLLLLIPTVIIGAAVLQLLRHEGDRINQQIQSSAHDRARAIGDTIQITVGAIKDELTASLLKIPSTTLQDALIPWKENNPLIRNVFIWKEKMGLLHPSTGSGATMEEIRFISRYDALFTGRISWETGQPTSEGTVAKPFTASTLDESQQREEKPPVPSSLIRDIEKMKSNQRTMLSLARHSDHSEDIYGKHEITERERSGWIPWFAENNLYILGWIEQEGVLYGIELELMSLLSRIIAGFPASAPEGMVYALSDGNGQILHQSGASILKTNARPDLSISLAPHLPHWQVTVYFTNGFLTGESGRAFVILSGLILGIFIIAIIIGGTLLTWQAHRNMIDARQKTSFVSNISHELKTPLTSIRMFAELLRENRVKGDEKKMRYLQVIVDESQRLTRLVNNVLDFSRLEQGRKKYHIERCDIADFLRQLLEIHRLRIDNAGLILNVQIPEEPVFIKTDRDAIEQTVLNLIDNAIKYASQGKELSVSLKSGNNSCELRVMDRGPGVQSDQQTIIFEKFHRIDDSLTAGHPGSGLGLSIAQRLVRGLDGNLIYEARDGGGSSFVVILPISPITATSDRKGDSEL